MSSVPPPSLVGQTIDAKYRLDALVGSGSMGSVYRATQLTLSKTVAIKVMAPELVSEPTYATRFKREAKAASRMDHANSLRVIDCGDDNGLLYIAMEFIDGRDLLDVVNKEWPLAPTRITDLLSQALAGLAVAHDMGIVHRDLKPENVMILRGKNDEGRPSEVVKVCDFGVAKLLPNQNRKDDTHGTATGTLTAIGSLIGTPAYMSPEQCLGEDLDARSDLYSLGVILYQLLTRRLPFEDRNMVHLAMAHVNEKPKRPSSLVENVDPHLEEVCLKALSKKPKDRYADAREMRAHLRGLAKPAAPSSDPEPPPAARIVPKGQAGFDATGAPSKAETILVPVPPQPVALPPVVSATVTEPSAAQLTARKRRRWIALGAIVLAVVLLLLLAR